MYFIGAISKDDIGNNITSFGKVMIIMNYKNFLTIIN